MLGLEGRMKVMQFTHFSVKEFLCLATSSQEHYNTSCIKLALVNSEAVLDHITS